MAGQNASSPCATRTCRGARKSELVADVNVGTRDKKVALEKAHSEIILSLGDMVLREVSKEKSTAEVWLKLESLYMAKSLALHDSK